MADTFIVHKEWLDNIAGLPIEQQDKIIGEVIRYGVGIESKHTDDAIVQAFVNMLKGRIDFSIQKYNEKVEMSKSAGRKKKIQDIDVYKLAREGKTSSEIAEILNCSKTAIDHNEGWRQRKNEDFVF